MHDESEHREERATFVSIVLAIMISSFVLSASFVLCGGFTLYLIAITAGLAELGYIHYLLWGHAMSEEVEGEREQEEASDRPWWDRSK